MAKPRRRVAGSSKGRDAGSDDQDSSSTASGTKGSKAPSSSPNLIVIAAIVIAVAGVGMYIVNSTATGKNMKTYRTSESVFGKDNELEAFEALRKIDMPKGEQSRSHVSNCLDIRGDVPRMDWVDTPTFAQQVIEMGKPIVFTNSPALDWKALERWTTEFFAEDNATVLYGVKRATDDSFSYYNFGSEAEREVVTAPQAFEELNLTSSDFVSKALSSQETGLKYYFNGPLPYFASRGMHQDVLPITPFFVSDGGRIKEPSIYLWLGSENVTANLHMDGVHNFFVQIHGQKRMTIVPPLHSRSVYLYPRLHKRSRQTQVNFNKPVDAEKFPLCKDVPAYDTVLNPGDVLYLPPYYFHHVTSMTEFVASISVWTHNREQEGMDDALSTALPFEGDWDPDKMMRAGIQYITEVLTEAEGSDARSAAQRLLDTRYSQFIDVAEQKCPAAGPAGEKAEFKKAFRTRRGELVDILRKLKERNVYDIAVDNWLEEVVIFIGGGKDGVIPLLKCMARVK